VSVARALASRALVALAAAGAVVVAWRFGGGAEPPPPPPPARRVTDAGPEAGPGDTYEVALRLVEAAKDARFAMTDTPVLRTVMRAHWRRLVPPFVPPPGPAARYVTSIALRTSATEAQWATAVGTGSSPWAPDARVWNMNEGSFDQREALVSTTPGSIELRVSVPRGAKLTFAEGTVNATDDATVFVVSVRDASGARHEVHRHALQPSAARRWTDASCDLSPFAGQEIDLVLSTERAPRSSAAEPGAPGAPPAAPDTESGGPERIDAGVVAEDALTTPSAAIALWGNPTLLARTTPRVSYNVLWIVVDALRPDAIASLHDDGEDVTRRAAPHPPLEALLPKVPGLTPAIDALAERGARVARAYSAGCWTRPGTLAMLAGARSSELGVEPTEWAPPPSQIDRFYGSAPPLLSLVLRRSAVTTRAFVNNYFMAGYTPVGIDMGFERVSDHRYRTRDTLEITREAAAWIQANKDTRFFAFVNYDSPHEPYEPPAKHLARVPKPPEGPEDDLVRRYMAEAAKDDEAIGVLLRALDDAGLREETLVVVTADHGETLSSAHVGTSGLDDVPIRYHHSASNYEETAKVPIVLAGPRITPGAVVKARARTIDLAPTVLDLLGIEPHPRMSGRSLLGLVEGEVEPEERVVVSEGRGSRSILHGPWRLIVREGRAQEIREPGRTRTVPVELFDLVSDPGERMDVSSRHPDVVAEMKARLEAALKNVAVAGSAGPIARAAPPVLHLRFAGGPRPRRVSGRLRLGDGSVRPARREVSPVELGREAFKIDGDELEVAFRTSPEVPVGFDVVLDPPALPVTWELWLDDQPWPDAGVFGGPFGLLSPALREGMAGEDARRAAQGTLPAIDPRRDVGLFVVRERPGPEPSRGEPSGEGSEGAEEMARLLREWGYAHGPGASGQK
jgi:arylsulfatase A-like enzyme